ncbi:phosphoribosyltransferase [Deinococcus aerolatus]|uniref:Phosphoribosyltransferase n=1 Tax=Deinococcus aerolatus TaxID=522487 RepID=A0ABQ2GEN9_9DEIO|nr:phosphoribosyltransferase family protein [Deinococcus aerolatus]GGL91164.1 phosphoribosyltransferase [Deinococcus aerolatus]
MAQLPFHNRKDAGRQLGTHLGGLHPWPRSVVLGLPRGGVPVAAGVAHALGAPLDVLVVRKLGLPGHGEVAMGAIAPGGVRVLNDALVRRMSLSAQAIADAEAHEEAELIRREAQYRAGRPPLTLGGYTALIVDDGVATGFTLRAALRAVRALAPARVAVAVPVAPPEICRGLQGLADEVICLWTPLHFHAVGQFYRDFAQTTDAEVRTCLEHSAGPHPAARMPDTGPSTEKEA